MHVPGTKVNIPNPELPPITPFSLLSIAIDVNPDVVTVLILYFRTQLYPPSKDAYILPFAVATKILFSSSTDNA